MQVQNKESSQGPTIVKRRARAAHDSHGGAWKVAFADFTLALMALFMVLWVMNLTPVLDRKRVAAIVSSKPIFEGGVGIFEQRSRHPRFDPFELNGAGNGDEADSVARRRQLAAQIQAQAGLLSMEGNVDVAINDDGIKISIHDTDQHGMFARASDRLDPAFAPLLAGLAVILRDLPSKIVLVGHTDSTQYAATSAFDNNWALSSRRALRARQALLDGGVGEAQIFQVSGMGNSVPAAPENPAQDRNRRIEILVLTKKATRAWMQRLGSQGLNVRPSERGAVTCSP